MVKNIDLFDEELEVLKILAELPDKLDKIVNMQNKAFESLREFRKLPSQEKTAKIDELKKELSQMKRKKVE